MAGSDPALACGYLQRFEVVLQPARSEVMVVGELTAFLCSCYTAFPALCTPAHTQHGAGAALCSWWLNLTKEEGWQLQGQCHADSF